MYETLHGTEIDVHEYPDCNAALERNIILDWETADPHCPVTHVPLVRCALCGYTTGGAYRGVTAYEILETVGIDIEESTPGEQMTPEIIRKFSDTDQRITDHTTERTQESLIGTTACRRCGDPIVTARGTRLCAQCEIWGCRDAITASPASTTTLTHENRTA